MYFVYIPLSLSGAPSLPLLSLHKSLSPSLLCRISAFLIEINNHTTPMVRVTIVELTRDRCAAPAGGRCAEQFWVMKIHHRHDKHIKATGAAAAAELLFGKLPE